MRFFKNGFAFILIFTASLLIFFTAPFSLLTGYPVAGLILAGIGAVILLVSSLFRPPKALFYILPGVSLLGLLAFYFLTLPLTNRLPQKGYTSVDGVVTIQDAIHACRRSGLKGWALAAHAQQLTARKFSYSRRNPWDSPQRAFIRGMGYCQQQALALKLILDALGIQSKPVQALKNVFPPGMADGMPTNFEVSGHVWLRVSLANEERDVCPGSLENIPGKIHFQVLSPVTRLPMIIRPLSHLGSAIINIRRDDRARRQWLRFAPPEG